MSEQGNVTQAPAKPTAQSILDNLKTELLGTGLTDIEQPVDAFLAAIEKTPSITSIGAQALALQAAILADGPLAFAQAVPLIASAVQQLIALIPQPGA